MKKPRNLAVLSLAILCSLPMLSGHSVVHGQDAAARGRMTGGRTGSPSGWIPIVGDGMKERGWQLGTFPSRTAGVVVGYYYYLPPGYETDTDKRYPVIYWLHGLGGSPAGANPVVSLLDAGIKAGTAPEIILVSCTDPSKRSMWTDSKDGRTPVETVIVQELIPHIDATFRTIATRQGRAVEGYSMGGYGAAYLGFKYPDIFGVVSILAGALHTPDTLNARRNEIFLTAFGGDAEYVRARSPWTLLRRNADALRDRTFVRIHVGEKDQLREWNTQFHELLGELRIDHTWSVVPNSTHSATEFFANWPGNLFDFYRTAFAEAVAPPRGEGVPPMRVAGILPAARGRDALATKPRGQEPARDSGMGVQPMNHRHELAPAQAGDADVTKKRGRDARDTQGQDALATAAGLPADGKVEESLYKKTPQGDLKIHIHFPPGWTAQDKRPAIVFFFGGGWTSGRVEQFEPQAQYLAQRGMVAARADYRVRSRHGTTPDKCVEDAKSAVRWLRANAAELGLDPQRIVASGGAAGGHIAACTATIPEATVASPRGEGVPPLRVAGILPAVRERDALDTKEHGQDVRDKEDPGRDALATAAAPQAEGEDLSISSRPNLLVLFNPVLDTLALGEKYGMGDIGRRISPNHHLGKDLPPTIVFFGTEDRFLDGGKEFIAKAGELGLQARMYLAPDQPHGFFNRSPWQQRTTFLMDEFLTAHGYLQGPPTLELPAGGVALTPYDPAP